MRRMTYFVLAGAMLCSAAASGMSGAGAYASPKPVLLGEKIRVRPVSGPPATQVTIQGKGFDANSGLNCLPIALSFTDSNGTVTSIGSVPRAQTFQVTVGLPLGAALGTGTIDAIERRFSFHQCPPTAPLDGQAAFTVTP